MNLDNFTNAGRGKISLCARLGSCRDVVGLREDKEGDCAFNLLEIVEL